MLAMQNAEKHIFTAGKEIKYIPHDWKRDK